MLRWTGGVGTWASAGYYADAPGPRSVRPLPILVGILAILIGLVGIVVVLVGTLILLSGLGLLGPGYVLVGGIPKGYVVLFGAIYFITGIVMLSVARGLWDLESWALWTTGIIVGIELASALITVDLLLIIVFLFLLVYLVSVRHHFR